MRLASATTLFFTSFCQGFSPMARNIVSSRTLVAGTSTLLREQRMAEKVLANAKFPDEWPFTESDLTRADESPDTVFYETPRLCYHIDDAAVAALTEYYGETLNDGDDVLDICSSWVSHFPKEWKGGNVVGLGMNEFELNKNERLSSYDAKDLNVDPTFPYDDDSFDKVTCVVSVDYLTKPKEIFAEIGRVLRPGGMALLSISNRCFPTKAWNLWLRTNDLEHVFIAGSFFHYAGMFEPPSCADISPNPGRSDPMYVIKGIKKA
mmetsp:Transcript_13165/g.19705  ORF Transcript_13165/g.19705 Transcript_13165/m.19705 type:complete len:264 (-) Transcript_13165:118-909(-)|eukprot:CAMPEP_0194107002 /NCGR_PEP_ID=MMETSP0150-20130528/6943_1 /TAXON_ID=122233 /ORGANISM="Chaetoceros debilis, Strain MM31A-1" /LENGTH=263 /DNA_ID=CAMNT_0038795279 /DNA_START=46 /DNA_END=837 /DNA_ORIENTATION=-